MFVPKKFAIEDLHALDALVERDAFATLISTHEGAPFATHLPVLYRRESESVRFVGHWARANPQWRDIEGQTVLLILHGPHAYVSPTWYEHPDQSVPTWNYTVAHVYGSVTVNHEPRTLATMVADLAMKYESMLDSDWRFPGSAPSTAGELAGIVGFEFAAQRVEIKHKLNQHHAPASVEGAVRGLRSTGQAGALDIANLMENALHERQRAADA